MIASSRIAVSRQAASVFPNFVSYVNSIQSIHGHSATAIAFCNLVALERIAQVGTGKALDAISRWIAPYPRTIVRLYHGLFNADIQALQTILFSL